MKSGVWPWRPVVRFGLGFWVICIVGLLSGWAWPLFYGTLLGGFVCVNSLHHLRAKFGGARGYFFIFLLPLSRATTLRSNPCIYAKSAGISAGSHRWA